MNAGNPLRWFATPDTDLRWYHADDECLLYHVGSSNTHVLNASAFEALESLRLQAANIAELVQRVSSQLGVEPDDDFYFQMETLLEQLEKLGLIECQTA